MEKRGIIGPAIKGKKRQLIETKANLTSKKDMGLLVVLGKGCQLDEYDHSVLTSMENDWSGIYGEVKRVYISMSTHAAKQSHIQVWIEKYKPSAVLVWLGKQDWLKALVETKLPVYAYGGEVSGIEDKLTGCGFSARLATIKILKNLKELGHHRIMYPDRFRRDEIRKERLRAYSLVFSKQLSTQQMEKLCPIFEEDTPDMWLQYWKNSLSEVEPTAVICDRLCELISLVSFCAFAKIRIPEDLSVVSLAGAGDASWLYPRPAMLSFPEKRTHRHFKKWLLGGMSSLGFSYIPMTWSQNDSVRKIV